jgi:hypothetical protein
VPKDLALPWRRRNNTFRWAFLLFNSIRPFSAGRCSKSLFFFFFFGSIISRYVFVEIHAHFCSPLGPLFFSPSGSICKSNVDFLPFFYILRVGRVAIISSPSLSGGGGEEKLTSQLVADWPTKLAVGWGGGEKATRRGNLLR